MSEQDSVPAHRACEMADFLAHEPPDFMPTELLSDDTIGIFSSVNKMKFIVETGSIAAFTDGTG